MARSLGPSGRGALTAITLWPPLVASLASLGFPTALNFHSRRQPDDAKRLYMGSALMMLIAGSAAAAAGAAVIPLLLHGYSLETVRVAQWLMLFAPTTLVTSAALAHLDSQDQFARSVLQILYASFATLVALGGLRAAGHLTPLTAALSYMVPPGLQSITLFARLWQRDKFRLRRLAGDIRSLLPYGLKSYGLDIVDALSGQMDLAIIVAFISPAQLGLYAVTLSLCRILNVVHSSVITVLFSRASSLDSDDAVAMVGRASRFSTVLCFLLASVVLISSPIAIPIVYGPAFIGVIPVLALISVETVLGGLVTVLYQGFMATGRPTVVTVIQVLWTCAAIALLFVFVPNMNIIGAGVALLCAALVRFGLVMAAYPLILRRPPPNVILNAKDVAYVRQKINRIRFERRTVATERAV